MPCPSSIKSAASMIGHLDGLADNRNCGAAAVVGRGRRIEGPRRTLLHCVIDAPERNLRRGRVDHRQLLTARPGVAAGIGGLSAAGRIEGAAVVIEQVYPLAENHPG